MDRVSEDPVKVCVFGAAKDRAIFLLHGLAEAHVFGKDQYLQLTLHDTEDRADELDAVAEDLQDACYPMIAGVQSEHNSSNCHFYSDVVFLLLEHDDLANNLADLQQYAAIFSKTIGAKFKTVAVVGHGATTAVGVLNVLCPNLNPSLLVAVDLPKRPSLTGNQRGGTYKMVQTVCEVLKTWLADMQVPGTQGVSFLHDKDTTLRSIPSSVPPPLMALLRRVTSADWPKINGLIEEFKTALSLLQLSNTDLVTSILHAKL